MKKGKPARKPKHQPRETYEGAKPLRYVDGKLYYLKNELLDDAVIKRVPSQQQSKLKLPKLDVPAIIEGALAAQPDTAA
jgi:hypothetical protein